MMEKTESRKSFSDIINGDTPVLVDFFTTWCGPCKMMKPILEELKEMKGDDITILKIDVEKNPQAGAVYNIQSVPTLILFKNGKILWRKSGVLNAHQLNEIINQYA